MSGFIKGYFGNLQCDLQDAALPPSPSPDNFLRWFSDNVSRGADDARGSWQVPEHENAEVGARLLLTAPALSASDVQTRWNQVQVIG